MGDQGVRVDAREDQEMLQGVADIPTESMHNRIIFPTVGEGGQQEQSHPVPEHKNRKIET